MCDLKITFYRYIRLIIALSVPFFFSPTAGASSSNTEQPQLKRVIMLFRHGVRAPNLSNKAMDKYSALSWPTWPVQPGYLTPHGFKLIQGLGAYFRTVYDKSLNLSEQDCKVIDLSYSRADNVERTRLTGDAFLEGFLPHCSINLSHTNAGSIDPYFHPLKAKVCKSNNTVAYQAVLEHIGSYDKLLQKYAASLALLQNITNCCKPALCKGTTPCTLLNIPGTIQPNGEIRGPVNAANNLIESIYLEKAEGFPSKDIGWGKIDDSVITQLDPVHVEAHYLKYRIPYLAETQGSNLAALIFASIKEAVQNDAVPPFVLLVGHDDNVDNIGALYGLNWHPKTYAKNQVPPASCLVFELYYYPETKEYRVKSYFVTQTLDEMAKLQLASQETPPEWVAVQNAKCTSTGPSEGCPYEEWAKLIQENLNKDCVTKDLLPVLEQ